jgi:hypothetical protein
MVQVFYEELNYETMAETPSYTVLLDSTVSYPMSAFQLVSAFADFGGLTGLWIGASVVSMLELLTLAYYLLKVYQKRNNSGEVVESIDSFYRPIIKKPSIAVRPTVSMREAYDDEEEWDDEKKINMMMSTASLEAEIYNLKHLDRNFR